MLAGGVQLAFFPRGNGTQGNRKQPRRRPPFICIAGPDGAILAVGAGESPRVADLDFDLIEESRSRYDYLSGR